MLHRLSPITKIPVSPTYLIYHIKPFENLIEGFYSGIWVRTKSLKFENLTEMFTTTNKTQSSRHVGFVDTYHPFTIT